MVLGSCLYGLCLMPDNAPTRAARGLTSALCQRQTGPMTMLMFTLRDTYRQDRADGEPLIHSANHNVLFTLAVRICLRAYY